MFNKKKIITFGFSVLSLCSILSAIPRRAVKTVPALTLPRVAGSQAEKKIAFARVLQAARAKGLAEIPAKSDKHVIRIATYNVDEELKAGGKLVTAVIKAVKADVMMLQGVGSHAAVLVSMLSSLGYAHYTPLKQAGNYISDCIIASKIPLTVSTMKKYDRDGARSFVKVELDLKQYGKQNVVIYGVSCDSHDASVRSAHVQEVVANVRRYDQGKQVIIGGNFNEHKGAATNYLGSQGFIDSFDLAGVAQPTFTHWSNQVLDRLYMQRSNWNMWIDGSYVLYAGENGRLPVIMDIDPTL